LLSKLARKEKESILKKLHKDIYILPFHHDHPYSLVAKKDSITGQDIDETINDRLFIWSLLLFGHNKGLEIIKHFWSVTNKPISCALVAMIIFKKLRAKQNFLNTFERKRMLDYIK